MKKHSARVAPLSACNSPVLTLTKVEGNGQGRRGLPRADARSLRPGGGGGRHPARAPWLWVSPRSPGSVARSAAPHACCLGRGGQLGSSQGRAEPLRGLRGLWGCPRAARAQGWLLPAWPQRIWQQQGSGGLSCPEAPASGAREEGVSKSGTSALLHPPPHTLTT